MISVIPCRDGKRIEELFKNNGIVFDEFSGCVIATDGIKDLGYCLYSLFEKTVVIHSLEPQGDIPLADGILRSALHVAAENFVFDARYSDTAPERLFELLDFIISKSEKTLNINKLFGGCNCHNKN